MEESKQYLGEIEPSESREIEPIIERIAGLEELLVMGEGTVVSDNRESDMGGLRQRGDEWGKKLIVIHGWEVAPDTHWEVDYVENKVWIKNYI